MKKKEKENKEKDKAKEKEKQKDPKEKDKESKKNKTKVEKKEDKENKKKKKRKQDDSAEEVFKNTEDKTDDDEADDQGEEREEEGASKTKKKPSARSAKKEKAAKGRGGRGRGGGKKKNDLEGQCSMGSLDTNLQNLSLQEIAALAEGESMEESEDCWFEFSSMFQKLCLSCHLDTVVFPDVCLLTAVRVVKKVRLNWHISWLTFPFPGQKPRFPNDPCAGRAFGGNPPFGNLF